MIENKPIIDIDIELTEDSKMSLNKIWGGVHWGVRSTFRNIWHEDIYEIVKKQGILPIEGMVHIDYTYYFKSRYLDTSNCSVMNKAIEDGFVEAGIFKDDTPQYITSATTSVPIIDRGKRRNMKCDILNIKVYLVD